jgi:hypothetical protein
MKSIIFPVFLVLIACGEKSPKITERQRMEKEYEACASLAAEATNNALQCEEQAVKYYDKGDTAKVRELREAAQFWFARVDSANAAASRLSDSLNVDIYNPVKGK